MLEHEKYMRRAIELAGNVPELPFAAVIVDQDTGEVIAEGWNKSSINPTWHGEIDAINQMAKAGCDWKATPPSCHDPFGTSRCNTSLRPRPESACSK
ncbi:MAG: deaminase [Pirellulaceae bacterium]